MAERLQKILSQAGIASRRAAEKLIAEGRVAVNGTLVTEPGCRADIAEDDITVDGKSIHGREKKVYFLLNKPKGYISTASDDRGRKTVLDLLSDVSERIYPIGRLDNATEGLLLLTNDGALMNALLHPKYEVQKTYVARLRGIPGEEALELLRRGVELEDGLTAPAAVRLLAQNPVRDESRVEIIIHEGRNRQVRRMCSAVGHEVTALRRTEFAGLNLSGTARGQYRPLTDTELAHLRTLAGIKVVNP